VSGLFEDRRTIQARRYDKTWGERLQMIRAVRGERNMARVLSLVQQAEGRKRGLKDRYPLVIEGKLHDLPLTAAAGIFRSIVARTVLQQVKTSTSKIIETGSGWGEHLCTIYLEGGPAQATYYALEPVLQGRQCARALAALEPHFKLKTGFFDYTAPEYEMPPDTGHTLFLTVHSIEQVAEIHPRVIKDVLRLGNEVTGIHVEPVGWQALPESQWSSITANHAARCREMNYNRNLVPLLRALEHDGLIRLERVDVNHIGLEHNPASLIVWHKR
jgi:hypothetical protein